MLMYRNYECRHADVDMLWPLACGVNFDEIDQIDLKPVLISLDSKKYSLTTKSLSSKPISQLY